MNDLIKICDQIAYLCRIRYEANSKELENYIDIQEVIDESLRSTFNVLKRVYQLYTPEAVFVFEKFFWTYLEDAEDWVFSRITFGKDFDFTKEFIKEMLSHI